ncbi:A-kinase anchor protein 9-like isoform X3 [Macrosteles quadrilineatus]|uniref:A-kinase anchor protein 9-like isoform X3 n=1 Tax=Macrosteles quadrilineatus TaxID=74068 RepID=UPI0023E204FD|nr:A-kinase anchor protein 9-like isoform X3 [Macrosteles quadrilineatus]
MDEKRHKVKHASNLLDSYIKSKALDTAGRSDDSTENPYNTTLLPKDKNFEDTDRNVLKMDSSTLKIKTDQFDSLSKKIKRLQDELSEKSERITALEIENKMLRSGSGDCVGTTPRDGDKVMIKDLHGMVDARDTFIQQLSDSLQKRSEELQNSVLKEKELTEEIHKLQLQVNVLTKQSEKNLSEAYSETVEYKAKVELMSSQIQEYSELLQSMRATLDNNNKDISAKKEELHAKEKKLEKYKSDASEDIKKLMRQVETLNSDLSEKEKELIKSKQQVESLQSQMEEQFGSEIVALKAKLENKYAEDVQKVELLYDSMLLEQIRKGDAQLKAVKGSTSAENRSHLEDQVRSLQELYEKEKSKYNKELQILQSKSKRIEERLTFELEKYKHEADHYRQQVENLENKVAEEVRKIQQECSKEVNRFECEMKQDQNKYEAEILLLGKQLKDYAINEGAKEAEVEYYKNELLKLERHTRSIEEKFTWTVDDFEKERSQLQAQIIDFKNNESKLMNELRISRSKLLEYENKEYEFNENLKDQTSNFNEKYQRVVRTFQDQIQDLMNELERSKTHYEGEKVRLKSVINEKENQIKNLEAKLNILESNKTKENDLITESHGDHDSVQQLVDGLKNKLMLAEKCQKSNNELLVKFTNELKHVKTLISKMVHASNDTEDSLQNVDCSLQVTVGDTQHEDLVQELEQTICDIKNMTQHVDLSEVLQLSKMSSIYTSTPRINDSTEIVSDDPGKDPVRTCELLEAENIKLTKNVEMLATRIKVMEYLFSTAAKENQAFDEKCNDLKVKVSELETLKFSDFVLKKENDELKERLKQLELSEENIRKEMAQLVDSNIKLEKTLNKSLVDLHEEVSNNGPNISLQALLSDLEAKSDEVVHLRSQLNAVQNALKDNQEKTMHLKSQCDKFKAEHEFMMSEIKTKQQELEEIWKERNELSTENKVLQSKLVSIQGKSSLQIHKIPSSIRCSSTSMLIPDGFVADKESETMKLPISETDDDFNDFHLKRIQTMHLLTESIAMSSKTSLRGSCSNLSLSSRIDQSLQQIENMFEPDHGSMSTILEEDEELSDEFRVFCERMAQGDQQLTGEEKDKIGASDQVTKKPYQLWADALRQLIKALFSEYTFRVKKMLRPWLQENETLDLDYLTQDVSPSKKCLEEVKDDKNSTFPKSSSVIEDYNICSQEFTRLLIEHCIKSLFCLKKRLVDAHNAVLKTLKVQHAELDKSRTLLELQSRIKLLEHEKDELEKKHKSAMELLVKDHETELSLAKSWLVKLQSNNSVVVSEDVEALRQDLEQKHRKEVEELRTYFEKKCADLEKHYSEEIYSQSQHNSKVSMSSCSSDVANIVDLYEDEPPNQMESEESLHKGCEKRISDLKELLENMKEKYKVELDSVTSNCDVRLTKSVCKMCQKNLMNGEELRSKQSGITLEQYYTEKIQELGDKYPSSDVSKDLELKVYQIKEEVRKDYELELDKIREEIVAQELKRKDDEIEMIKAQLNEAHKVEIDKLWRRYEELANKEVENSVIRVKNEVILTQELEEKSKYIDQLKHDKKELLKKQNVMNEQKSKDIEQMKFNLQRAHKKEVENMKQAFEIELTTRIDTIMEEKIKMETKYKKQIEKLQEDVRRLHEVNEYLQQNKHQELHMLTEEVRKEILRALELQIKAMVETGDVGEEKSSWPPELAALERQFTSKYQQQMSQLVEEHTLEMAEMRAEYETKIKQLENRHSINQSGEMPVAMITSGDPSIDKVIEERDNLRNLTQMLRRVVQELANYLTTCEDELNRSIVGQLIKLASPHNGDRSQVQISVVDDTSDSEPETQSQRKVHFAPNVSHIVALMDENHLFDTNGTLDLSVHFHTELEHCLERLRDEASALLGLSNGREALPSTVEDRRMTSLTRQLIEEKKAKEKAYRDVQELQELVNKYEKELNELHKELTETKDRMIKEKVTAETEFSEKQTEERVQNLCHLQEKARALLSEKGECPSVWLGLIEELCSEGDSLLEEAWRERDELKLEVEAADKQLRSTRAFLEEQAMDREQERDEFGKEICRLNEILREKDREFTSNRHIATECTKEQPPLMPATADHCPRVDALELQVKETSERLKESEEKKEQLEKECKTAIEKVWTLREIIEELESQVSRHCEREAVLEARLVETQTQLTEQVRSNADTLQQLHNLRDCTDTDEEQPVQQNSRASVLRQVKSQLRTLAKSMERHIKELEAVNIHVSSASLSSPSEDVSIRDQLEVLRCLTPETHCPPSPPCPPLEEFELLSERLLRYSRAAENVIKKLRDRDMQINRLRAQNEELQTEHDVLQNQRERALMQVASLTNKVEELRVRSDKEIASVTQPLTQRALQLEQQNKELSERLCDTQRKLEKLKQKLERSEGVIQSHESKIRNMSDHQHELVEKLTRDLETMRAEKLQLQAMVEKYRTEDNVSFPQLIEVMLAEKNADIDQLQQRVEELSQQDQSSKSLSSKSRGLRVSFADSVAQSQLGEGERVRDFRHDHSSIRPIFSTPLSMDEGGSRLVPRVIGEDLSKIPEPEMHLSASPNRATQLENVLSQLKSELEQKTQRLLECEVQLHEFPSIQQKLDDAREQLESLEEVKQLLTEREKELEEVKTELAVKEEENVRTRADVKALQGIMEELQQKLKEAKSFAEFYENNPAVNELKETSDKYKEECDTYKAQLAELRKALDGGRATQEDLQKSITKLETDKQNILSDLVMTKSKCKSLQEELESAVVTAKENSEKVETLRRELEESLEDNNKLSKDCQRLKKNVEQLTRKQKAEMKNMLRKDSDDAIKLKDELENLKLSNSELQSENESLHQKLEEVGNNLGSLLEEINKKDDKLQQLHNELRRLDDSYKTLKNEKASTEQFLNNEIAVLKVLRDDLNKNLVSLEKQNNEPREIVADKDSFEGLKRKYESLKREYERQRRARRETEKKNLVLKNELMKEKEFSAHLRMKHGENKIPSLVVSKSTLVDIRGEGSTLTNSLDDLTDEVQKELNVSARLDQTLLSELQTKAELEMVPANRSDVMPPRTEFLTTRLAELEAALHVERVMVNELRARLAEERGRYLEQSKRVGELQEEVAGLQTLNDQLEDKFKGIAHQLERQVDGVKELIRTEPLETRSKERELQRLLEENQSRMKELLQERVFNRNQLMYLNEELAKAKAEKLTGNHLAGTEMMGLQQALENRTRELEQMRQMLNQANLNTERTAEQLHSKLQDLQSQLDIEEGLRKTLESKIKSIELAERSRHLRRKTAEEKLKEQLNQAEKAKRELERECMALQLRLRQSHLQIKAHTDDSPLALRLRESNVTVERLVGEKEDLLAANTILKEEKEDLLKRRREQDEIIEDLKSRIHALNIKVVDGGVDNLNAMFAAERAAWLQEKEALKKSLARSQNQIGSGTDSYNGFTNSTHLLQKYLKAESHRKALVWQKRYLMVSLRGYQTEERQTVAALYRFPAPSPPPPPTPEHRFRVAVCTVRAVFRMQFLVDHRKQTYDNTCRLLQRALNSARNGPYSENITELQTLWRRNNVPSSSQNQQPGSIAQYIDRFNSLQDRIKNALSTSSQ